MVNIEPYQYQKVTNVKEHNDIVAKINEIVDVINNSGADTLGPRIDKLETDVSAIDSAVKIQYQDIASIKDKDQVQDNNIGILDAQVKGITESLISNVNIIDGTTTGKFKVRLDREKAPSINSNDYDLQKATSIELIQGSGPSMLKAQITLSDGTILISDDFLFTTEAIGTDVYISSFVFKNGNVAGTISADIGLSNGTTIEANNFVVPMDPSLLNTVQDLSTRLTAVEGGSVAGFKELEAQVNTNKTNIATLTTEIGDLDIAKADQSNPSQTIKADTTDLRTVKLRDSTNAVGSYLQFNADANKPVRMEYYNGTEVVDSGFVATIDNSGNPKNFTIPSSEGAWEVVHPSILPKDWKGGYLVKATFKAYPTLSQTGVNWNTQITGDISIGSDSKIGMCDFPMMTGSFTSRGHPYYISGGNNSPLFIAFISKMYGYPNWNKDDGNLFDITLCAINGVSSKSTTITVTRKNIETYVNSMWRLKN